MHRKRAIKVLWASLMIDLIILVLDLAVLRKFLTEFSLYQCVFQVAFLMLNSKFRLSFSQRCSLNFLEWLSGIKLACVWLIRTIQTFMFLLHEPAG